MSGDTYQYEPAADVELLPTVWCRAPALPISSASIAAAYAASMLAGAIFPPLTARIGWDGPFAICDGHHRFAAAVLAGYLWVPVIVVEPIPWCKL